MSCSRNSCCPTPRCYSKPCNVPVPKSGCNPYALCVPLYPCNGRCVPVNPCGSYCQPFPTPDSKHMQQFDNEATRNKEYPQDCVPKYPGKCCF